VRFYFDLVLPWFVFWCGFVVSLSGGVVSVPGGFVSVLGGFVSGGFGEGVEAFVRMGILRR
jgi:hypothetical protein